MLFQKTFIRDVSCELKYGENFLAPGYIQRKTINYVKKEYAVSNLIFELYLAYFNHYLLKCLPVFISPSFARRDWGWQSFLEWWCWGFAVKDYQFYFDSEGRYQYKEKCIKQPQKSQEIIIL